MIPSEFNSTAGVLISVTRPPSTREPLSDYEDAFHRVILAQCYRAASESPDPSTQVGSVIVGSMGTIFHSTISYNGFVRGWEPTGEDYERPRKYEITTHSERRAIYRSARMGIALAGCTLYSTWGSCNNCAIAIVESGISKLVRHAPPEDEAVHRWLESVQLGDQIMKKGGVEIIDILGSIPGGVPILRGGELYDPT